MRNVSLRHIKRVGLVDWKHREWWIKRHVMIWSGEHHAWWRPDGKGYTDLQREAWSVDFPTAYEETKHCGPEKKVSYFALPIGKGNS